MLNKGCYMGRNYQMVPLYIYIYKGRAQYYTALTIAFGPIFGGPHIPLANFLHVRYMSL